MTEDYQAHDQASIIVYGVPGTAADLSPGLRTPALEAKRECDVYRFALAGPHPDEKRGGREGETQAREVRRRLREPQDTLTVTALLVLPWNWGSRGTGR